MADDALKVEAGGSIVMEAPDWTMREEAPVDRYGVRLQVPGSATVEDALREAEHARREAEEEHGVKLGHMRVTIERSIQHGHLLTVEAWTTA